MIIVVASTIGFKLWVSDVRQAYLQSDEPTSRPVFIKTLVPEFKLSKQQAVQLLKPLNGLSESGDFWFNTLDKHHIEELGMRTLRSDPALYVLRKEGEVTGLSGAYVDDMIRAGSEDYHKLSYKTNERFEMAEEKSLPCTFTGFKIGQDEDGIFTLEQNDYLEKITILPHDASFHEFFSMRMNLAWLAHSRPDCLFEVSQLNQVTKNIYEEDRRGIIRRANKLIKYTKENKVTLSFKSLDKSKLKVIGFSDASFATNCDFTSQLGYIIFVGDFTGKVSPAFFKSYKARRVTRSVMAAELIAFSDMFDAAFTLAEELRTMLPGSEIPLNLFTDKKALFDVISKGSRTSEKRLMLDIACTRESFKKNEINNVGFIRSSQNIADGLTKSMAQHSFLSTISSGKLDVSLQQW